MVTPRHERKNSCLHARNPGPPMPSVEPPEWAVRPAPPQLSGRSVQPPGDPRVAVPLQGGDGGVIVRGVVEDLGAPPRFLSVVSALAANTPQVPLARRRAHGRSSDGNEAAPKLADLCPTPRICQRARIRK